MGKRDTSFSFVASILCLSVLQVYISALVLYLSWGWFVVPLGLPPLQGLAHAFGLGIVAAMLHTPKPDETKSKTSEEIMYNAVGRVLGYVFVGLVAWMLSGYVTP